MDRLNHDEITLFFLSLAIILVVAKALGELATRLGQPAIFGELVAGVLLGPTILGRISPAYSDFFFPHHGFRGVAFDGLLTLSVTLFLLVAGLEVDLSSIWRQGRTAFSVSVAGVLLPFCVGFPAAWFLPELMGRQEGASPIIFALFFATALSITAMPVIAKTLMDLNLYRSDMGMLVMAAATFDDLFGWIFFSVILAMMGAGKVRGLDIAQTVALTLAFAAFILTIGRWLMNRTLPWVLAHTRWPTGVLGYAFILAFLGAAYAEWVGVKALFGAFLVGVALGDSPHLNKYTRATIEQFVSSLFAPIFFASIAMRVDFVAHFDPLLCGIVFVIACFCKLVGCGFGARLSGMPDREALATAVCMNARGVMEIILGLLALQYGVIDEKLFVALTVMAMLTSLMVGPIVQRILKRKKPIQFVDFLWAKAFVSPVAAHDRRGAIVELCQAACGVAGLPDPAVASAVLAREETMSTGLGDSLAVPHARLDNLNAPVVAVGLSPVGIDFDSPDGSPAHLLFLVLTPSKDNGAQMAILSDIARTFKDAKLREKALEAGNYTQFLALLKTERGS